MDLYSSRYPPLASRASQPLESQIRKTFIPPLTGQPAPNNVIRDLLALSTRVSGMETPNPVTMTTSQYAASQEICKPIMDITSGRSSDFHAGQPAPKDATKDCLALPCRLGEMGLDNPTAHSESSLEMCEPIWASFMKDLTSFSKPCKWGGGRGFVKAKISNQALGACKFEVERRQCIGAASIGTAFIGTACMGTAAMGMASILTASIGTAAIGTASMRTFTRRRLQKKSRNVEYIKNAVKCWCYCVML